MLSTLKINPISTKRSGGPLATISFQPPGEEFGRWLDEWSAKRGIKRGEACRRLVLLSTSGMDSGYHDKVAELATALGVRGERWYQLITHLRQLFSIAIDELDFENLSLTRRGKVEIIDVYLRAVRDGTSMELDFQQIALLSEAVEPAVA